MRIDKSWYIKPEGVKDRLVGGGVVCRVFKGKVNVLLVQESGSKKWGIPKGGVERGETTEEGARREVREESGAFDLKTVCKLGIKERLTFKKKYWSITHYFLFVTSKDPGEPTDKDIKYVSKWFPIDKTSDLFWPEQKDLIDKNKTKIEKLVLGKF